MKRGTIFGFLLYISFFGLFAQSTIKLTEKTLMHEMRETPSPLNNAVVSERTVNFMWSLKQIRLDTSSALDGMASHKQKIDKSHLKYQIRYARNARFNEKSHHATTIYPFYIPEKKLSAGKWYWQYGYEHNDTVEWSPVLSFTIVDNPYKFTPPSFNKVMAKLPTEHPRIWVQKKDWDAFIQNSMSKPERDWYITHAEKVVSRKLNHIDQTINTRNADEIENEVKRNALIVRESRRIVDREEKNTETLIRAYLLTKDKRYFHAVMQRIDEMVSWRNSKNVKGDFNESTLLSLSSMAYDSFYDLLSHKQKQFLLKEIKTIGTKFYNRFNNHLENHIADNHTWQMSLRIFTMAAFAAYGELPEASQWAEYTYDIWLLRFPGLNNDGAWHNGDSYFHVNIKTLIEVPFFYSRITGFDFFTDPWYAKNALYVIYQQPPFSKSGGNGSSHQKILKPSGTRVGYADALAKLTNNSYAADYVRRILEKQPDILKEGFLSKSGDLAWFRLQMNGNLPEGRGLIDLPLGHVFLNSGLASLMTRWDNISRNTMLTFRSSPYGSTSHALANQNAYNIFYGGKPIFYSSGHHVSFTDHHSIYCHRATRAHNSILVNGMGQRIGTDGYGWIPRHYIGDKVSYILGDASNAYGKVISPLWLKRGAQSELEYTPENGWDRNHVKTFRRHIVTLGNAELIVIYDELEADTAVTWSYLLHTLKNKMNVMKTPDYLLVTGTNDTGIANAYLFAGDTLVTTQTDKFFYPAINWLRADDKGYFKPYENHWHFTATSPEHATFRFLTIIDTHDKKNFGHKIEVLSTGKIKTGNWVIDANISLVGKAAFTIENKKENIRIEYDDTTRIIKNKTDIILKDKLPKLEI